MEDSEFYKACEDILGVKTEYKEEKIQTKFSRETGEEYAQQTRATRWGGREPGNGRFPGCGLIRIFGNQIQVALKNPSICGIFNSHEDVLEALKEIMIEKKNPEIGDKIDVCIMGKDYGKGIIVEDHNDDQWVVTFEMIYPNGYKTEQRRYIDKTS